jgi:diacylglycerol kinase family enzyme
MKGGNHLKHMPPFNFYKARELHIELEHPVPIQCDGERLEGLSFKINVVPNALNVLFGRDA